MKGINKEDLLAACVSELVLETREVINNLIYSFLKDDYAKDDKPGEA